MTNRADTYLALALLLSASIIGAFTTHAQIVIGPGDPPCFVNNTQPKCLDPVLIVPGIGASYNSKLMLKDQAGGTWKFAPTLDWYDPLIERLESEGYELGTTLFVVHYDWRNTNLNSAIAYLKPAITAALAAAEPESGKVDIVAHSMGGLVARAYTQSENLYDNDVDQLILLGTPNEGAAGAYVAWEGGDFPTSWDYASRQWLLRIDRSLRKVRNQDKLRPPQTFRLNFPSIRELLPINPYVQKSGADLAINNMSAINTFLQDLATTSDRLGDRGIRVTTIAGDEQSTIATIPVSESRTATDATLERWRDGHPNPDPPTTNSSDGDQTVLTESVNSLGGTAMTLAQVAHGELPGKAQSQVVQTLRGRITADEVPVLLASSAVGVDVLSPVQPVITGPGGQILSATQNDFGSNAVFDWDASDPNGPKVLTISNPPAGTYTVTLTGTDTGEYTVITSYADGDETTFEEFSDTTTTGAVETYTFIVTDEDGSGSLSVDLPDPPEDPENTNTPAASRSGEASSSGDQGDGPDCCPGPDTTPSKPAKSKNKTGRVLGATTIFHIKVTGSKLVPYINYLHRLAYQRNPSPSEHAYWLARVKGNQFKRADQLLGAMQWHRIHNIRH